MEVAVLNIRFRLGVGCLAVATAGWLTVVITAQAPGSAPVPVPAPTQGAAPVPTPVPAVSSTVWDGVYTDVQARAGESDFKSYCLECHGEDLAGREQAPALAGPPFLEKWNKANLRRLMDTMEAMPPDNPKSLTAKQYAQIMAYVLYANAFPAGKTALPEDRSALAGIQILGTRPDKAPR
jgi:mono/diheme cytochrome c family protein